MSTLMRCYLLQCLHETISYSLKEHNAVFFLKRQFFFVYQLEVFDILFCFRLNIFMSNISNLLLPLQDKNLDIPVTQVYIWNWQFKWFSFAKVAHNTFFLKILKITGLSLQQFRSGIKIKWNKILEPLSLQIKFWKSPLFSALLGISLCFQND